MDKLLDAVKDFSAIKRYLEAINQTTDDFLYMYDIPNNQLQFFGNIYDVFKMGNSESETRKFEEILSIVHPADRTALIADMEKICRGEKAAHNIDFRMINVGGKTVWVNSRGKVLHDENGAPYVMIGRLSEEALRHLFNPVTGLWNKTKLREDLKNRLASGKGWLMLLGIPTLSDINLSHGRSFGNQLLGEMANILEDIPCIEESYHVDNNDFALIISDCDNGTAEEIYGRICGEMMEKCSVFAGVVPIDNSVFIDASQLMDSANITLQNAMQNVGGGAVFFSSEEIAKRINEQILLEDIKKSIQNDFVGFEVYYQPQIRRGSYELYGVEALLRYNSKARGRVFPDEFIPLLEPYPV